MGREIRPYPVGGGGRSVAGMAAPECDSPYQHPTSGRRRSAGVNALGTVIGPLARTGGYYAQSWRDYLNRQPDELPIARPSMLLAAHAFRDEIVLLGLRAHRPVSDVEHFERINTEVHAALDFYGQRGWLDKPSRFFAKPPPLTDIDVRPVQSGRRHFERMHFVSGYSPRAGEPGAQRWLSYTANTRSSPPNPRQRHPSRWSAAVAATTSPPAPRSRSADPPPADRGRHGRQAQAQEGTKGPYRATAPST